MIYTKEDFKRDIHQVGIKDFELKGVVQGWLFVRDLHYRSEKINISYRDYAAHGFYIDGVSVGITFTEIENILNPLLLKYGVAKDTSTISKVMNNVNGINYSVFGTEINSQATFNIVATEVKKILDIGVLPFFEKYNSLHSVADLLYDKKPEEIVPYIQGAILLPKSILILKQAGHPNYRNKLTEFHQVLIQYAERKDIYKLYLKIFNELFEEDLK
jgi:hypothetical protein